VLFTSVSITLPGGSWFAAIGYNSRMPLDLQRVRALCFDIDGTLSDTDDQYVAALTASLRLIPFLRDRQRLARRLVMFLESPGNLAMGIADRLGFDDGIIDSFSWFYSHSALPVPVLPPPIPGVVEMIGALAGHYPMAVVSARDQRSSLGFLDASGMRPHFRVIVTALTTPHTKPFPDPVLHASRLLGVPPESCLMIGDTTVDILAGRRAGAQTVGVLCGFGERDELRRHGADLILPSTADLRSLLLLA
jgi:N-acetyl-D-muramate 6-phosphate phosphatase